MNKKILTNIGPNIGRWASGGGLIGLLILAAWVWVLPALKPPSGEDGTRPDLTAQVPPPAAAKTGKAVTKAGKAAATGAKSGGQTAAVPKAPPGPSIDLRLPPPTKTATLLPKPAAKHWAWYEAAAKLGNNKAQLVLAELYLRGEGVEQSYARAGALYRQAAVDGNEPKAQYALAVMLERGIGIKKDMRKALLWYRKAAESGYAPALLNLGFIHIKGVSVSQDFRKARDLLERAAAKNLAEAQYNLGLLYQHGLGVEKDMPMAFKWFTLAIANQNAAAGKALHQLTPTMTAADITRAKQLLKGGN